MKRVNGPRPVSVCNPVGGARSESVKWFYECSLEGLWKSVVSGPSGRYDKPCSRRGIAKLRRLCTRERERVFQPRSIS